MSKSVHLLVMLALLFLLGSILFTSAKNSVVTLVEWEKYYAEGYSNDAVQDIVQTEDGGYVFAAPRNYYSSNHIPPSILLFRTDSLGVLQWQKRFNESKAVGISVAGLAKTSDGGFVFAGGNTEGCTELIKTDTSGNMQWNRTYRYAGYGSSMVQTNDGGFAIAGTELGSPNPSKLWLVKTDSEGNLQWNKMFEEKFGSVSQLIQTFDGNYVVVGYTYEDTMIVCTNESDLVMLKIDKSGDLLWRRTFNQGATAWGIKSIVETSDEGYVLTNEERITKTDKNGTPEWSKTYSTSGKLHSSIVTSDGGLAFVGTIQLFPGGASYIWLVKTDLLGNVQWNQTYGGRGQYGYTGTRLIESSDGDLVIGGNWQWASHIVNYYMTKIDASLPAPTLSPSPSSASAQSPAASSIGGQPSLSQIIPIAILIVIVSSVLTIIYKKKTRK